MHNETKTVLLTGFGPFPGVRVNESARLVTELAAAARRNFSSHVFLAEILDTAWLSAPEHVTRLMQEKHPALALHFGVAQEAQGFRIERHAANACLSKADAVAKFPTSPRLDENGPPLRAATIDAPGIAANLSRLGFPAAVSDDAGGYLCNAVLYHSLAAAADRDHACRTGFIHIPADLSGPPLPFDRAVAGALAILDFCLKA